MKVKMMKQKIKDFFTSFWYLIVLIGGAVLSVIFLGKKGKDIDYDGEKEQIKELEKDKEETVKNIEELETEKEEINQNITKDVEEAKKNIEAIKNEEDEDHIIDDFVNKFNK
jgi:gas vesicle protein